MNESCLYCRFYRADDVWGGVQTGVCRRNPPIESEFPKVAEFNWCGEFQSKTRLPMVTKEFKDDTFDESEAVK